MNHFPVNYYESLLVITNSLVSETNERGLFQNLALSLQSLIHCDRCTLSIYDTKENKMRWFARAEGLIITCLDDGVNPQRGPLASETVKRQKTFLVPDLRKLSHFTPIRSMIEAGLRWSVGLPLIIRGQTFGALCISFIRPMDETDKILISFLEKISVQVALAVDNMLSYIKLENMNLVLKQRVGELLEYEESPYADDKFFFQCEAMQKVVQQVRLLATKNLPILICGETGTGKDFIARMIHRYSNRNMNNFIKVNCPALSPALFESELFGHGRGAFTGAHKQRIGRFELADKGSIFLDEIGDLDKGLQAKLLQVVQESSFERVGESVSTQVDVRFISATNVFLDDLIKNKEFRKDLYYRLGAAVIYVPPLRERKENFLELVQHMISIESSLLGCKMVTLHKKTIAMLEDYPWPGNLRELSNIIKRLLILYPEQVIMPETVLPFLENIDELSLGESQRVAISEVSNEIITIGNNAPEPVIYQNSLAKMEQKLIEDTLKKTNGVVSGKKGATLLLGLSRTKLLGKLKKYNIIPQDCIAH